MSTWRVVVRVLVLCSSDSPSIRHLRAWVDAAATDVGAVPVFLQSTDRAVIEACAEWTGYCLLPLDDAAVYETARLSARMARPMVAGNAAPLQDKLHQRAALSAAGLPGPPFARVDSPDDVIRCGRQWGFPIMVKPTRGAQSRGVSRVDRPEQAATALAAAYGAYGSAPGGTALAEGFVAGQDIAVESMVLDGVMHHVSFSQSGWCGDAWCAAAPLAPHLQAALPEIGASIAQANSAMGLRWAATSNELRLTETGPVIIEVNARLGGGPCEDAVRWHTGIDRVRGLLAMLIGNTAAVMPAYRRPVAQVAIRRRIAGAVRSVAAPPHLAAHPDVKLVLDVAPGDVLDDPGGTMIGWLVLRGSSNDPASALLSQARALAGQIVVETVPD